MPSVFPRVAVVDVETTGLFPFRNDRVVEIAAVVVAPDGSIEKEFVSLVNPVRDIGPSSIHGISSADILSAPQFEEIAAHLIDAMAGTVAVAGHNVRFDLSFLDLEFRKIGQEFPRCTSLCTMQLAHGGRLVDCCDQFGIKFDGEAHNALIDARATARLLTCLLSDQPRLVEQLNTAPPIRWPLVRRFEKSLLTRGESRRRQAEPPTYLQRLLDKANAVHTPPASDGAVLAYLSLLGRVLDDRFVDESEADALVETATRWGLTADVIRNAHYEYFSHLSRVAASDAVTTESEKRDLMLVARLLGIEPTQAASTMEAAAQAQLSTCASVGMQSISSSTKLAGARVCFTGELQSRYQGNLISREVAESLATEAGLVVINSVTKKLDLLVVADPQTQSGKARKARELGKRVVYERVFWSELGVKVE